MLVSWEVRNGQYETQDIKNLLGEKVKIISLRKADAAEAREERA
jgi:uncharacterized DUF497 family protein